MPAALQWRYIDAAVSKSGGRASSANATLLCDAKEGERDVKLLGATMISRILGKTVCTAVLATCAGAQTIPLVEQIAGRLTANALKADVSFLASDAPQGRANPSPELRIAA